MSMLLLLQKKMYVDTLLHYLVKEVCAFNKKNFFMVDFYYVHLESPLVTFVKTIGHYSELCKYKRKSITDVVDAMDLCTITVSVPESLWSATTGVSINGHRLNVLLDSESFINKVTFLNPDHSTKKSAWL